MTREPPSIYEQQLQGWSGFQLVKELRDLLAERQETIQALESSLPGISLRLYHVLDIVREFEQLPAHTLPVQSLQGVDASLGNLLAYMRAAVNDPAGQGGNVQATLDQTLAQLLPLTSLLSDRSVAQLLGEFRASAQSVLHGIRTSAGRTESKLEETIAELKRSQDEAQESLRDGWEKTKSSLVAEAAQMRERTEAAVSEARTNAEAHLTAMRNEVAEVAQRADDAYRETLASFEAERQSVAAARAEIQTANQEVSALLVSGAEQARERISAEVSGLKDQLEDAVTWARDIKGDIQIAALAAGFRETERRYRHRAWSALTIASLFSLATIGLTIALFSTLWDVPEAATNAQIARHIGLRIGAISLPLVVALFSARVYRTFSHLEAVNGERAQAATAFEGFAARASTEEARDGMLVVLAQLVFAGRDTGHHADEKISSPVNFDELVRLVRGK